MNLVQELEQAMNVNPAINEGIFASQGCVESCGNEWSENTWTQRLVGALHDVKYTAELDKSFLQPPRPHCLVWAQIAEYCSIISSKAALTVQ